MSLAWVQTLNPNPKPNQVPQYQPERAFAFFSRWLEGRPFIDP